MILFIDTTKYGEAKLVLIDKNIVGEEYFEAKGDLSEKLAQKLPELLRTNKIDFSDLKGIIVVKGTGSFMGTRSGVAYANAISWSKNIPIAGIEHVNIPEDLTELESLTFKKPPVSPTYGAPPNITKPKNS